MSHLLAISIGPVQEFIAAGRRTRDVWFGSYLLPEISRTVAQAVEAESRKGKLIFPAKSNAGNVANVILAELPGGDPKEIAAAAKEVAKSRWREFADDAFRQINGFIRTDIWDDQVDDVIEFYAAWVARTEDYREDRRKVMRLLAGRKNCRDFQSAKGRAGVPKSSLDGRRETVFKDGDREAWTKKLRLLPGEQLDVVGVTKRLGKERGESVPRYPSVSRVAAETWLSGARKRNSNDLKKLNDACKKLVVKGLNTVREENYQYFPYEGTVIFKDRHPDLQNELGLANEDLIELKAALKSIGVEPNPYLAVLVADGDRIGAAIAQIDSPDKHRDFSTALDEFADEARKIVAKCNGVLVYAGGDDVLAFLPIDQCLKCSRDLHEDFGKRLDGYGSPTLSVGIAIGHFMENLEDLLEYGRTAEKAAKKPDRDGLAVHLHKRGGSPIRIRAKWGENPDDRLIHFAELMNGKIIPTKLPYELRSMAKLYENWTKSAEAIQQDLYRLIAKKSSIGENTVREVLKNSISDMDSNKLLSFAEELLVSKQIAVAMKQAGGEA
jgi:CRISPR-associated protein Cmr2